MLILLDIFDMTHEDGFTCYNCILNGLTADQYDVVGCKAYLGCKICPCDFDKFSCISENREDVVC